MSDASDTPAPKLATEAQFWELALATNAAFKGLLASMGQSGHICGKVEPLQLHLPVASGWIRVQELLVSALRERLHTGDVVVIADKVVAASLQRLGPARLLHDPDPKTVLPAELIALAQAWQNELGFEVHAKHLLLADAYGTDQATLGTDDPNGRAAELAQRLRDGTGQIVDVVISDTDTGLDTRAPLIDMVTIGATPIGATGGLNLYEAMRCAVAAEFVRGHDRGIPVVVCIPATRRGDRVDMGLHRHYSGLLSRRREKHVAHA